MGTIVAKVSKFSHITKFSLGLVPKFLENGSFMTYLHEKKLPGGSLFYGRVGGILFDSGLLAVDDVEAGFESLESGVLCFVENEATVDRVNGVETVGELDIT